MEPTESAKDASDEIAIGRPEGQLQDLTLRMRWEATRRHPYYLAFWASARCYLRGEPATDPDVVNLGPLAASFLRRIGVIGEPPDPATEYATLTDPETDRLYVGGALQPLTLRMIALMLFRLLPVAERQFLNAVLNTSASPEYAVANDPDGKIQLEFALRQLAQLQSPALDSIPDAPLYYVHLGASQRVAIGDLEVLLRNFKRRRNIPERRVRTEKHASYLKVWDLKEGWTGATYDRSREHTFSALASQLKLPFSTAVNHYRSAFQLITGHPFTPKLWWRLMGSLKIIQMAVNSHSASSFAKPFLQRMCSPKRRPVPDSVVSPVLASGAGESIVSREATQVDETLDVDLRLDLIDLIERGESDAEIVRKLELSDPAMVPYLRERVAEMSSVLAPKK